MTRRDHELTIDFMVAPEKKRSRRTTNATPRKVEIEKKRAAMVAQSSESSAVPLMTAKQICDYLQIGRSTLGRYVKNGLVPSIKLGRHVRFDVLAVRAAIERNS